MDFAPQLGTQNRPKSLKNRCQDAFHLGLNFLIDFWSVFGLNLDAFDRKKLNFFFGKILLFENTPFGVIMDFWFHFSVYLARFWYPKPTKIHPKIDSKRHQKNDAFLHRVFVHFSSNLESKLGLCWRLFRLRGGDGVKSIPFFWCVAFFYRFFAKCWPQGPMGYPILGSHLGLILEVFGLILASCWGQVGAILGHLGTSAGTGWAGGDTRSAKNYITSL